MRMRELAARAELPRTTIQHYLRERLLPEPERTARNAAVYSETHLERLRLIRELRARVPGGLPLARVRRILELVERGVDLELAIGMQEAVHGDLGPQAELLSLERLSERSGVEPSRLRELVETGVLLPAWDDEEPLFDDADLELVRRIREVGFGVVTRDELASIAERIAAISELEMEIRNREVAGLDDSEATKVSLGLQQVGNFLHRYLFARNRQRNIEALHGGVQPGETKGGAS